METQRPATGPNEVEGLTSEQYRALFRHAPIGQAIYDLEGRVVEANAALHEMLGYDEGELVDKHVLELTHPDDHPDTRRRLGQVERGERTDYQVEKRYLRKDGSAVWCRLNVVTVFEEGEPAYFVVLVADVTEARAREEVLGLALEQFRGVFAHAPIGLAILDDDGVVVDSNPELSRILGRGRDALTGHALDHFRPPEDVVSTPSDLGPLLRGEVPTLELERRFTGTDGRYVHTLITLSPLASTSRRDTRVVALVRDTTEQRQAEWRRELAERRFRTMFEDAAVGQVITTLTGEVLDANPTFLRIVDRPSDEVIGSSLLAAAHPEDSTLPNAELRRLLFGDVEAFTREQRFVRPDGGVVHTELHLAMGPGASGGPEHLVVQVADVTERKEAERRLAETLAELEERNQDLEHFASIASHDLKTPLQTVVGFLELLLHDADGLTDDQRLYAERAMAGGVRMRTLIESILGFARSGTQALQLEPVRVGTLVGELVTSLGALVESTGGHVEMVEDGDVLADRAALAQVLQNLVANALKFGRDAVPPHVRIDVSPEGATTVIRVADNGHGIAPEQRGEVFEMFSRGRRAVGVPGSGIGLTTCRRLVERMGGAIAIEDSPLGGVTMAVSLPTPASG